MIKVAREEKCSVMDIMTVKMVVMKQNVHKYSNVRLRNYRVKLLLIMR